MARKKLSNKQIEDYLDEIRYNLSQIELKTPRMTKWWWDDYAYDWETIERNKQAYLSSLPNEIQPYIVRM